MIYRIDNTSEGRQILFNRSHLFEDMMFYNEENENSIGSLKKD